MKNLQSDRESWATVLSEIYGDVQSFTRIFQLFILLALAGMISGFFILLLTNKFLPAVILAIGIVPVLASFYMVRQKRFESATTFLAVFLILMNTILATMGLGIHNINNFAYPAILIIASLVTRKRTMFYLTLFTVLCIAWLVFGELQGLYKPTILVQSVPGDFFSASLIVVLTAVMVYRLTGSLFQSFSRLQNEISERKTMEGNLLQREAILEAVTFAAEQFLKVSDWRANIDPILERLGKTINATHAYLFEHSIGVDEIEYSSLKYEWTAPGHTSDFANPKYQIPKPINLNEGSTDYDLRHGRIFSSNLATLSPVERERLLNMGVKAMVEVPLFVDGKWWGTFGLDDLENEREWSPAEVDALKIAAGILSAAIQRQKAESAVHESERIYRRAIEAAGAVPYYRDYRNNRYAFMGEGIVDITGYSSAEMTPETWDKLEWEGFPRGNMAHLTHGEADRLTEEGVFRHWECDYRIINRRGQTRWVADSCIQIRDEEDVRIGVIGILQDITDRKLIEANLRKRESTLEAITFSAEQFLKASNWRDTIDTVLQRLGEEFNASHAYLFESCFRADGVKLNSLRYEWVAPGQRSDLDDPLYQNALEHEAEFAGYYETLNRGDPFIGSSSYFTKGEREHFNSVGIKALLEMRIFVDGAQWGTIGFDDMVSEREWTAMEVDVLKVAANVLGAAIKRQLDEDALKRELGERQRAEQALKLSEEKFSKAFHTTQVFMTIEDEKHRFVDANRAFMNAFGVQKEDLIGHNASELNMFYAPDDAMLLRDALQKNDGDVKDYEMPYRRRNGDKGFIILSSEKIKLDNVEYTLTSGLDITERKLAEMQIQQQAARAEVLASLSQTLTQANQDYHLMLDTVVRRCAELIGDGASIFLYSPGNEFLELAAVYNPNPEAMEIFQNEIEAHPIRWNEGAYAKAVGENQPVLIPFIPIDDLIKRATPERRQYYEKLPIHSMMLAPLHVQGKVIGVIGMARHQAGRNYIPADLTFLQDIADRSALAMLNSQYYRELEQELAERKRAEQKYRDIFNNSIEGIFQSTEDGHFLSVNPAMARIYGYDSPEDMLNSVDDIVKQIYVNPEQRDDVRQRLNSGERLAGYETLDYRKDGSTFWASMSAQAIHDENGKILYYEGTMEDITPRKTAETEREALIQELAKKNAELEQFTYTVSHDLKSPLVTINGFLGYLEQDAASGNTERLKRDTQRIQEAVRKMQRLLNELLELSRIGRMMNAPEAVLFDEIVREAMSIVHGRLEERRVVVQINPNLPAVYGDRPRLVEVLQNLIDNAAKYMGGQSEPRIEIGQRGVEDDKPIFFVRDNGMGIDSEYHERIFGLFNKLDPKSEGTGVGLALVKRIVEFHGGRIWVESEAGMGAAFLFTLPSKPEPDSVI